MLNLVKKDAVHNGKKPWRSTPTRLYTSLINLTSFIFVNKNPRVPSARKVKMKHRVAKRPS